MLMFCRVSCNRFLPTPSARRATGNSVTDGTTHSISTHALREEGDVYTMNCNHRCYISTHALREEGDFRPPITWQYRQNFYPRPPRGGRPGGTG